MSSDAAAAAPAESPWEQGSLLPADIGVSPLQWVHPANPATKAARGVIKAHAQKHGDATEPIAAPVALKQGDRLMVITQTCDIVKPASDLPQIEVARVFATTNECVVAQAQDFGSFRFFKVGATGDGQTLILDYGQRALLDKGFLEAVEPDNTVVESATDDDAKKLARWLGRRYSRPAIPDQDYEEITRPVREAWKQLLEHEPDADAAVAYNSEYAEWRYRREDDGTLTIYILSSNSEPDAMLGLEVADFLTQAIEPHYPAKVTVATDHRSYHTFTKADELSTEQISMEWASRDEAAGDAALPG